MRKRTAALAAALAFAFTANAAGTEGRGVAGLGWLAGSWLEEKGDSWTEESWSSPRGGVMLGTNASGKGRKNNGYEFLRIAADEQGVVSYWASPGGSAPVPFRLLSSARHEAVFENPANDYPTRISYRRQGNVLTATISGPGGAKPMSWIFRRR